MFEFFLDYFGESANTYFGARAVFLVEVLVFEPTVSALLPCEKSSIFWQRFLVFTFWLSNYAFGLEN